MTWLYIFDLIGCGVFAISGAILAHEKKMDGIGVLVLAGVTAVGGGTIRDVVLDAPVFWIHNPSYLYAIVLASVFSVFWLNRMKSIPAKALEAADALGLALFVVMGTQKALSHDVAISVAVLMGMITGCFGGMIRDVLANRVPLILQKEMYAFCCLVGASVYVLLNPFHHLLAAALAFTTVLLLRLAAIKWRWQIHVFKYDD